MFVASSWLAAYELNWNQLDFDRVFEEEQRMKERNSRSVEFYVWSCLGLTQAMERFPSKQERAVFLNSAWGNCADLSFMRCQNR